MKSIIIILSFIIYSLGVFSQTTYIWSGAVNSNFGTAGNWTPIRQVGLASDNLIFNTGTLLNITNVNQVTIGQIAIKNNTQLKLTPAPGNPRVISIQGASDSPGGGDNGAYQLADSKYQEYMNEEPTDDIASQKYREYMSSDSSSQDIATLKYNEYKTPSSKGMGDLKTTEILNDEDLTVEPGSSLTITGNNPKLSIYLKQSATAAIYGSLVFQGEGEHGINSNDMYAITFREGSSLIQSCPGNVFSTTGVNNSALFENGSVFEINHTGALDLFGMNAPSSKVTFNENSNIKFNVSGPSALKLNGRTFPNLIISSGCNIIAHENLTSDVTINNLIIDQGGKLNLKNLSAASVPGINIKGNISVNGELKFPESGQNKLTLNLNGENEQLISGSGVFDINTGINKLNIYNDIKLNCNLDAYCDIFHHNGFINTNGYYFRIYGQYVSKEMIFVGIVVIQGLGKSNGSQNLNNNLDNIQGLNNNPGIPQSYSLSQNYPNPFNPKTNIDFGIPEASDVNITVYNLLGKEIASLVNNHREAGSYGVEFDGTNFASGVYIYRITTGKGNSVNKFSKTLKMVLAK